MAQQEAPTYAQIAVDPGAPAETGAAKPGRTLDTGLLVLLVVIVGLVAISNVWLRRRATREKDPDSDADA
jgi:hypothetical protein